MVDIFSEKGQKEFRKNLSIARPQLFKMVKLLEADGFEVRGCFNIPAIDDAISLEVGKLDENGEFVQSLRLDSNQRGLPSRWSVVDHGQIER